MIMQVDRPTSGLSPDHGSGSAIGTSPVYSMVGVSKTFGAVTALNGVDLSAHAGEVLAIVGGNGAGKSTLISIGTGALVADCGVVSIDGAAVNHASPTLMRSMGMAAAYQHPALIEDLTVEENLLLATSLQPHDIHRFEELAARLADGESRVGLTSKVADLDIAQRHIVEICRAVIIGSRVLILDEPTEPFRETQVRGLFEILQERKAQGCAIIYVSHRLHEVFQIADKIAVIRDGSLIETRCASAFSATELVGIVGGRPRTTLYPGKGTIRTAPAELLRYQRNRNRHSSEFVFALNSGEIVGVAGIEGQGQRQFIRALAGIDISRNEMIHVQGQPIHEPTIAGLREAGICFLSDDRHREGLFMELSIEENIGLGRDVSAPGWSIVDDKKQMREAKTAKADLRIRAPSTSSPVEQLSGGNQQKVLLARELNAGPKILLIDEPTKGVDVGARAEIYAMLRTYSENGNAVAMLSSDVQELVGLCDRVVVFSKGTICEEIAAENLSQESILAASLHGEVAARQNERLVKDWLPNALNRVGPTAFLILAIIALAAGVTAINPLYLEPGNLTTMFTFAAILGCVAASQLTTVMLGGVDLSVGPLLGLVVVISSFFLPSDAPAGTLFLSSLIIVAACALFAWAQSFFVMTFRAQTLLVTLATFVGLQGFSLMLRPVPGGEVSYDILSLITSGLFGVPWAFIFAAIAIAALEVMSLKTSFGRSLRAVGSNPAIAARYGVRNSRIAVAGSVIAGGLTGIAGIFLAAEIGIGSPNVGVEYTLLSLAAVAVGGAKINGGSGSYVNTLLSACLLQMTYTATTFLGFGPDVQFWTVGIAVLLGALLFRRGRGLRPA